MERIRDNARTSGPTRHWTVDAVLQLGLTTDVETAGDILGIGRTKAYELAKADEFPVDILRIGRPTWSLPPPS
jgi:hypothetical protein